MHYRFIILIDTCACPCISIFFTFAFFFFFNYCRLRRRCPNPGHWRRKWNLHDSVCNYLLTLCVLWSLCYRNIICETCFQNWWNPMRQQNRKNLIPTRNCASYLMAYHTISDDGRPKNQISMVYNRYLVTHGQPSSNIWDFAIDGSGNTKLSFLL